MNLKTNLIALITLIIVASLIRVNQLLNPPSGVQLDGTYKGFVTLKDKNLDWALIEKDAHLKELKFEADKPLTGVGFEAVIERTGKYEVIKVMED